MGLLFLFVMGIAAIILIARWGSKTRPKTAELALEPEHRNGREQKKISEHQNYLEAGLINLLIRKKIISEEELLSEIELLRKIKEEH